MRMYKWQKGGTSPTEGEIPARSVSLSPPTLVKENVNLNLCVA